MRVRVIGRDHAHAQQADGGVGGLLGAFHVHGLVVGVDERHDLLGGWLKLGRRRSVQGKARMYE